MFLAETNILFLYHVFVQTAKYIAYFGDGQGIFSIFCSCFVHKHKSILVCLSFRSVVFPCSVENHCKYMCNYFIMFCAKSLIKLCLRASNDIFNVLPPNICQCLQCVGLQVNTMLMASNSNNSSCRSSKNRL